MTSLKVNPSRSDDDASGDQEQPTTSHGEVSRDDDEESSCLFPMEALNAQLRNSDLLLEKSKLEAELQNLEQERVRMESQYETTLDKLLTDIQTLEGAKKALQKYCRNMEDLVREHRFFDTF